MAHPVVLGHQGRIIRLGFVADTRAPADRGFRVVAARGTGAISDDIWLAADKSVPIYNQMAEGSCAGHATAEGDLIEARRTNPSAALGSRQWLYRCGRVFDGTVQQDAGTTFSSILTEASRVGIPPESAWPYLPKTGDPDGDGSPGDQYRADPPANVIRLAYDRRSADGVLEAATLDNTTANIGDTVDEQLGENHPVCVGLQVGDEFCSGNFDPSVAVGVPAQSSGGHAMLIVGRRYVRVNGSLQRWYLVRNSWSDSFANGGRFWMTEEWMSTGDLWVVNRVRYSNGVAVANATIREAA